jgi:lysophospholipase L1-like esterase
VKNILRLVTVGVALVCACSAQDAFQLKNGDRVVFFGDSITDQRLYTTFIETYVLTRFPDRQITFVHSGWGGDRVTGGAGGGIETRLTRDVIAYHPNVVTIMLGMNDGRYRPFNQQIFDIYSSGYERIVKRLKSDVPGVRITLIQPSPYDDVTRPPKFAGGYNGVLLRYGQFVKSLADSNGMTAADLNGPVTAMLEKAMAVDPELAQKIIPDRVHPGPAGHLIMAESLLRAWGAPAIVSSVEIDAAGKKLVHAENTEVSGLEFGPVTSWTQTDRALPMPVDMSDPVMALTVNSSDFMDALNRQAVKVTGLAPGKYTIRIDGEEAGAFDASDLAAGVNLARLKTPMWSQAHRVHELTLKHNNIHFARWRSVQVPMQTEGVDVKAALDSIDGVETQLVRQQREAAKPVAHRFELVAGDSAFQPIFNGKDLTGWHISKVNHHGNTQAWEVRDGVIRGTQDKPGNGGILLTDRKYRNFEISLDINPDYGCDSGLFLRSNEKGQAYQVMLDYLDGGALAGIYGEGLQGVRGAVPNWQAVWKRGEWNHMAARIEGDTPHIQVWLNGVKVTDWRDTANHLPDGAVDGMIALQVHGGNRWIPGGYHRFRNISVRELP